MQDDPASAEPEKKPRDSASRVVASCIEALVVDDDGYELNDDGSSMTAEEKVEDDAILAAEYEEDAVNADSPEARDFYLKQSRALIPAQAVAREVGFSLEKIGAVHDAVSDWSLMGRARPTDEILAIENRFQRLLETADPNCDYIDPDVDAAQLERLRRLWPAFRAIDNESERRGLQRYHCQQSRRRKIRGGSRASIHTESVRRSTSLGRTREARCGTATAGSRRTSPHSSSRAGPSDLDDGDAPGLARARVAGVAR